MGNSLRGGSSYRLIVIKDQLFGAMIFFSSFFLVLWDTQQHPHDWHWAYFLSLLVVANLTDVLYCQYRVYHFRV